MTCQFAHPAMNVSSFTFDIKREEGVSSEGKADLSCLEDQTGNNLDQDCASAIPASQNMLPELDTSATYQECFSSPPLEAEWEGRQQWKAPLWHEDREKGR